MALPATITKAVPAGSEDPSLGDNRIREVKDHVIDILGVPNNTAISAAGMDFDAAGLVALILKDASASAAGHITYESDAKRNEYHDGVAVRYPSTVLHVNTTSAGNSGAGEDTLMTYSLGANTLTGTGSAKTLRVTMGGRLATGVSGGVTVKFHFGATALTLLTDPTPTASPRSWRAVATISRVSATSQHVVVRSAGQYTSTHFIARYALAAETESGTIVIKCTGEGLGGNDNDAVQDLFLIEVLN